MQQQQTSVHSVKEGNCSVAYQQQQRFANNILILRGSRNENGQIVIQNKQDILSFIQEQQHQNRQPSEQTKNSVAVTLAQLPTTTTTSCKSNMLPKSGNRAVVTESGNSIEVNTILLQTPLYSKPFQSVLVQQQQQLKKINSTISNNQLNRSSLQLKQVRKDHN